MAVTTSTCRARREVTRGVVTQLTGKLEEPTRRGAEVPRLAGEPDFDRIYRLHQRLVYSLCLRISGNPDEAEDLTQEAFVQLFRKVNTFRGESSFRTWLYRLVTNVVLMGRRRKDLRNEASLEELTQPNGETNLPRNVFGAADAALTGAIDRVSLERAILQLPLGYRIVFVLHDVQGYEHNEIAEILGLTEGTSKSQLHKARLRLREMLREAVAEKTDEQTVRHDVVGAWKVWASADNPALPSTL